MVFITDAVGTIFAVERKGEPMNDLISRQAAIDAIKDLEKWYYATYHEKRPTTMAVVDTLTNLPSAPQWIPVTERLPEKDGIYIVCLDDGSVFEYDYISKWWDDGAWQYCGKDVVAWLPLPDPYKEEEDETD